MNTPKLPPLPHWCEPGSPFAEQMQAYAIAAIQAQGAPNKWREFVAEVVASAESYERRTGKKVNAEWVERGRALLTSAPPAPQAQGVPDGWQLVPKEPTDAMIRAALHLDLSYMPGHDGPDRAAVYKAMLASAQPAPQPAQAHYLEMIYEYLVSTAPAGYADEAFREVPEEVFAADSRNRISERRASLSQHTGQLPAALGQEEVGTRQAGFDVTSAHPAPQQKPQPLSDEQIDAGIAAWFKTEITTNDGKDKGHPFRQRMRAAINAAHGIVKE